MKTIRDIFLKIFAGKAEDGEQQTNDVDDYKERISRHRRQTLIRALTVTAVVLLGTLITKVAVEQWKFKDYKVLSEKTGEDTVSARYAALGSDLLKYSSDGAVLIGSTGKTLWNQTYEMESPAVDVCETAAVVYSQKGTEMVMLSTDGKLGQITTQRPILKARVAAQGVVAAILEDGENTWINYYSTSGEQIATAKTRVDSPGYPVDLSLSNDGLLLMVTYLFVEDGATKSYVAFYNFGNTGQNQMDNMVSSYTYDGVLIPQVKYLDESTAVAFRDDGFTIYTGKQIPKEKVTVKVEKEIISTFCDQNYIGMVFRSDDGKQYQLQVYRTNGKQVFEKEFDSSYNEVKISRDSILLYNDNQLCVFSMKGVQKFKGNLDEGAVINVFKSNTNTYQLVTDNGVKTIKLK